MPLAGVRSAATNGESNSYRGPDAPLYMNTSFYSPRFSYIYSFRFRACGEFVGSESANGRHLNENTVYRFTSTIWYGARSRGVYPVADWGLAGCAGCACRGGRARVPGVACGARYSGAGVGRGVSGDSKRMRIRVEPFSHRRASGSGGQPQAHRVHQTRGAAGRSCFCGSPCGSFSSRPPLVPALIVGRQPLGHT